MDVKIDKTTKTGRKLTITADAERLGDIKKRSLKRLGSEISVKGFRKGKAPASAVEKTVGDNALQSEVLEDSVNFLYLLAINQENLRPIDRPQIEVKKYVPYTSLEFTADIEVISEPKLGDYKKIKKVAPKIEVSSDEVEEVIKNLQTRSAGKEEVTRKAKIGDEVTIDFEGFDKDGKSVEGGKGSGYPLSLGSGTFIPGFEENLVGLQKDDEKEFEVTFPKDYGSKKLAGQKVTFKAKVTAVKEVILPKADNKLAQMVGPFKTLGEMKEDIKMQLERQKSQEASNKIKDEILEELVKTSEVEAPQTLVDDQLRSLKEELIKNITYRGLTPEQYYEQEGMSEVEYAKKMLEPQALKRVQVGLVLSEVVSKEGISLSDEEIDIRIQLLQSQYQDPQMQAQLSTPEYRQDIANRMLTEKTVNKLYEYAIK